MLLHSLTRVGFKAILQSCRVQLFRFGLPSGGFTIVNGFREEENELFYLSLLRRGHETIDWVLHRRRWQTRSEHMLIHTLLYKD
jgi:hypothetical protein